MIRKKYTKYIKPVFESQKGTGSWFGYYNYDPINISENRLLCNRARIDAKEVEFGNIIDIGFYDILSGKWNKIGESDSYNWPQGAMLQWLPGKGNENKVIFNTSKNNHNISRIIDIETGESRDLDWSIYGLTPDGKKSIALDMERQHWCRGYHYESVKRKELDVRVLQDDGIFEIDLERNMRKLLININDVINTDKEDYFDTAKHWLEHIMISPSGKRICFLHRFSICHVNDYETRLFISNIDGSGLQIIDNWRTMDRSHFGWKGDDSFVIYGYNNNKHAIITTKVVSGKSTIYGESINSVESSSLKSCIKKILPSSLKKGIKRLLCGQTQYYQLFKFKNGRFELQNNLILRDFDIDGHPSFTKDGKYMITDSYPDCNQFQRLIVYNTETGKSLIIAKLYAALHQKAGSCDLHPKLCKDNRYVTVDSAYDGEHHIMVFEIDWKKIKSKIG